MPWGGSDGHQTRGEFPIGPEGCVPRLVLDNNFGGIKCLRHGPAKRMCLRNVGVLSETDKLFVYIVIPLL